MKLDFNDPPDTILQILLRWGLHFALGCFFALPIAVLVFGAVGLSPNVNLAKAAFLILLFICAPVGAFFWLIGLYRSGEMLYSFLRFLGQVLTTRYWS